MKWTVATLLLLFTAGAIPATLSAQEEGRPTQSQSDGDYSAIGGAVSAPVLIKSKEAKYSREARKAKMDADVLIGVWISSAGLPDRVWIVRGVGYGLDESALDAVRHYRFQPAMRNGEPVKSRINVSVSYRILR